MGSVKPLSAAQKKPVQRQPVLPVKSGFALRHFLVQHERVFLQSLRMIKEHLFLSLPSLV